MTKAFAAGLSAIALIGAPVAAAPAPASVNPAARLSIAPALRAATPAKNDRLAGGFSLASIIAAVAVVVGIVIAVSDDGSDSN